MSVRMKVSSQTQTEEEMLKPKEPQTVDADLGGSSGVPKDCTKPGQPNPTNIVSI